VAFSALNSLLIVNPSVPYIVLVAILVALRLAAVPSDRRRSGTMLLISIAALFMSASSMSVANSLTKVRPLKYDQFIYRIDEYFGQPSFALGSICNSHPAIENLAIMSYGLLAFMMVFTAAVYIWSSKDVALLARALFLNLFLAVPFYLLIPVCGPAFAYSSFPQLPDDSSPHMIPIDAAPNGIPSVHMATALLILWFLRHWWWGWLIGVAFVLLTILATLGLGQHYVFDLICAVPYAVLVYFLA
jgi:hypothetical protein